jgi:hypothetical protein
MPTLHYQILLRAREIIADERNWTTGTFKKRTRDGRMRYCAWGAIHQATLELTDSPIYIPLYQRTSLAGLMSINDLEGHKAVLAHLDKLIARNKRTNQRKPYRVSPSVAPELMSVLEAA